MKKSNQINVKNIPPEVIKEARKKAIDQGRSLSDVLRELLQEWAKDKNPQPAK
jgi:plasmid stability protein